MLDLCDCKRTRRHDGDWRLWVSNKDESKGYYNNERILTYYREG